MPHFDKHFTLAEALALLPHIREIFLKIQKLFDEAREGHKHLLKNPEELSSGRTNGDQKKHIRTRDELTNEINELVIEIADRGIVIQDIYRGLIDFPAYVNGEEVFLCYELNDGNKIKYYHNIDAGFAGRQPLPEDTE
jgi:hypothetical protein